MGLRICFIITLIGVVWLAGPHFYKGNEGCAQCHTPHFESDGTCLDCHRGDRRTGRMNIAHSRLIQGKYACFTLPENSEVKEGRRMMDMSGCRRCHKTGNQGNRLATDLDAALDKTLPEELARAIKYPAVFMPDFYFSDSDIANLVNAVLGLSAVWGPESAETPTIVYFEKNKGNRDNPFNIYCGSCHRVLTQQFGGLGQGDIGPNLSGIFTRFYFKSFNDGKSWNTDRLEQWLKNPRDVKAKAQMLPVRLTQDELEHLIRILSS